MATQLQIYSESLRLIGASDIANTSVDEESRYVLDSAYSRAILYCLSLGWWKFAFFESAITLGGTGVIGGYTFSFTKPTNWLRTHSVGYAANGRFLQVDSLESGSSIFVNYAQANFIRYTKQSSTETDPANWPEVFARVVAAYLAFDVCERLTQSSVKKGDCYKTFQDRLQIALEKESHPDPLRLPEHAIERAARRLLEDGFWRFAMKTVTPSVTTGPAAGFAYVFANPADNLRTYDVSVVGVSNRLFLIDRHEETDKISAQHASIRLRHVSTDRMGQSYWPEAFVNAVEMQLAVDAAMANGAPTEKVAELKLHLDKFLDAQLGKERMPRPMLLGPDAVERVVKSQLESGLWKFAIKTTALTPNIATPRGGFTYAFDKPADWQRTVRVYYQTGSGLSKTEQEIDYLEENQDFHANYTPIQVRYVMNTGNAPTNWTELFAAAFEAGLRYENAIAEGLPEATVQARKIAWDAAIKQAATKDALNERPKVNRSGSFNAARVGYYRNREQGY